MVPTLWSVVILSFPVGIRLIFNLVPPPVCKISFSPIWLLGEKYETSQNNDQQYSETSQFKGFEEDLFSRIWMTYRKDFPVIPGSFYTSDMGWGCMHRTGQMTLAQALQIHILGRS